MQIRLYWISIFEFKDVPGSDGLWSIYNVIPALMWTFLFVLLISMIEFQMRWSPGANPANTNFQIICFTLHLPFILSLLFFSFFFAKVSFTHLEKLNSKEWFKRKVFSFILFVMIYCDNMSCVIRVGFLTPSDIALRHNLSYCICWLVGMSWMIGQFWWWQGHI